MTQQNQDLLNTTSLPQTPRQQHDYILLDASSSMSDKWWSSLEAIDNYVSGLKAQNVSSKITLATFTHSSGFRYDRCRQTTVEEWKSLSEQSPDFWAGTTPLYDAINQMTRELRDLDPPKCSILIVTDGEENGSATTAAQAKAFLDWCRAKGWQVTFFGCDFESSRQAKMLGVGPQNAIGTSAKRLTDAASTLAKKRAHHAHFGTPMNFSEDEQQKFAGYLTSGNGD
jgi:von Willebrand factor type A domain